MALKNQKSFQNVLELYKKKEYPFKLLDNLKCIFCSGILHMAVQSSCGCRYCKECIIQQLKNGNQKCLGVECDDIESYIPDIATTKEIAKLEVKCLNEECEYKSQLKDMDKHLDICDFQLIKCPQCHESNARKDLDNHLKESCKMRIVKCEYCNQSMTVSDKNDIHYNIAKEGLCPKYVTICPNKCDIKDPINLLNHREQCTNKHISCPYVKLGCQISLPKEDMDKHIKDDVDSHLKILMDQLEKVQTEYKNLKLDIVTISKERDSLQSQVNQSKFSNSNIVFRNGVYIWKISNFSEKRSDAENGGQIYITSDSFYTSEFGYKMSMKVYPAGDGVGKNTNLSVFFTIMRGEYDDILKWPFRNNVTLSIIDQQNKEKDHTDTFKPDPRSSCYQKPQDEHNIASGSPKFITFENLIHNFLHNNTIYLKIQVLP